MGNFKGDSLKVVSVQESGRFGSARKRMRFYRHGRSRNDGLRTGPIQPHTMEAARVIAPVYPAATAVHGKIPRGSRTYCCIRRDNVDCSRAVKISALDPLVKKVSPVDLLAEGNALSPTDPQPRQQSDHLEP